MKYTCGTREEDVDWSLAERVIVIFVEVGANSSRLKKSEKRQYNI